MELTPSALVLIGLLLAAWTFGAVWVVLSAQKRARKARAAHSAAKRLSRMIDESPAIPMLVRGDGKIEGPHRLAGWLGLSRMPGYLSELEAGEVGLTRADMDQLSDAVRRTQKTAAPFRMTITPIGSEKSLAVCGQQADPLVAPPGSAQLLPFVTNIVREREEAIEAKDVTLDLRGDKSAGTVMADRRQLDRAIGNILDNSIAAVPQGEGRILVMLARRKNSVRIVVSDNGAGMLPGELARALDGYVLEGDGSGKEKRGLGLPLARQLIEAHGGRLNIQSEKGAGTTATITLP